MQAHFKLASALDLLYNKVQNGEMGAPVQLARMHDQGWEETPTELWLCAMLGVIHSLSIGSMSTGEWCYQGSRTLQNILLDLGVLSDPLVAAEFNRFQTPKQFKGPNHFA